MPDERPLGGRAADWVGQLTDRELLLVGAVAYCESADAGQATEWWAGQVGVSPDRFHRPTLKRHNPRTTRLNTGDAYHGCLIVAVPRGRRLYWQIEGVVQGLARALMRGRLDRV